MAAAHPLTQERGDPLDRRREPRRIGGRPGVEPRAAAPDLPVGDRTSPRIARERPGRAAQRPDPGGRPSVGGDPAVHQPQPQHPAVRRAVGVPDEVPEAVVDVGVLLPAGAERYVGVAADDDVGPGVGQGTRGDALTRRGARLHVPAPVQVDHHHVGVAPGPSYGAEECSGPGFAGGRQARRMRPGRPGATRALERRRVGGQEGQVGPVHADPVRREGVRAVLAHADDRERCVPSGQQGVLQPDGAEIGAVVVGHRHHVDAGVGQDVERPGRGAEPVAVLRPLEGLRIPAAALGDRTLQVDHGDVGVGEGSADRTEPAGVVQEGGHLDLEVDVAGEREGHLVVPTLVVVATLVGGRPPGLDRRRRGRARRRGGAGDDQQSETQPYQAPARDAGHGLSPAWHGGDGSST